jgi:hypothetical protein
MIQRIAKTEPEAELSGNGWHFGPTGIVAVMDC